MDKVLIGQFLRAATRAPIVWGQTDCAMVAAGVWLMVTGYDPMQDLRGTYSTRWQYLQIAARQGGMLPMALTRMNHPSAHAFAGNGIGLLSHKGRRLFAVSIGGVWVAPAEDGGLLNVTNGQLQGAWGW